MEGVNTRSIILIWVAMFLITPVVMYVKIKKLNLQQSGKADLAMKKKMHNKYVFYSNNLLTRKRFRRIVMRYATMSCYDVDTVKASSVKLFQRSVGLALAMPLVALIAFQNIMLALLVGFVGYIYYNISVDRAIDKIYEELISDLALCVQSIHDNFVLTQSIPAALLASDKGQYLATPITKIYEILTDVNGEEILYQFKRTTPVRMVGTLATVCYIANNEGEHKKSNNEETTFETIMTALRREADTEVRRLTQMRIAFKSLSVIAIVGLCVSPLFDMFLLNKIPGTTVLIKGMYGSIEKTIIILVTMLAYYIISILNRPGVVNQVDTIDWIETLSRNLRVRKFVQTLIPKKYKSRAKLDTLINESISSKSMEYIYTLKPVASIFTMCLTLIVIIGFIISAKVELWNNHNSLSFIPSTYEMTETRYKQVVKLDKEYMKTKPQMDDEAALTLVKARVPGLNEIEYLNEVERLKTKYTKYYNIKFKWYYILVIYLAGVVAWFTPEMSLKLRKSLVKFEANEDVMQLQTLMICLANTNMDVFEALYWLASESTVHKAPLYYAYLEYPSDPEFALQRLKDSVQSKDLKRMVAKLEKAIYSLSMSDAFNDIRLDKEQSLVITEMLQKETINSKKEWGRLIASAPISLAVLAGFVLPIMILGVTQLLSSFSTMNG